MNDRYLYRAKRIDNGEWTTGFYVLRRGHYYILPVYDEYHGFDERYSEWIEIDPRTVCQCTGLVDKNGKLIWENDIIIGMRYIDYGQSGEYESDKHIIKWNEERGAFVPVCQWDKYYNDLKDYDVIGNVFDNPELLEVGE